MADGIPDPGPGGADLTRVNPSSTYTQLDDGHPTLLVLQLDPTIGFWEKTVKPPGMDGGDAIDTTTMHNDIWRTMVSRSLVTMTPCNLTAAYDPEMWCSVPALINAEGIVAVIFPNGDMLGFYGFLQSVEPQDISEGAQPEVNIVVGITNCGPTDRIEYAPVWVTSSGTACTP